MLYDIAVIGGGAVGTAVVREISRYKVSAVLLEKNAHLCSGVSKANSGIIHAGFHHDTATLKSRLEIRGNQLIEELSGKLHFKYHKCGIITAAFAEDEIPELLRLYRQGSANGVRDMELCSRERLFELEKNLDPSAIYALYAPHCGTVEPYEFVFSLAENAMINGVEIRCNFHVAEGKFHNGRWQLFSSSGECINARCIINAAGLYADEVSSLLGAEKFEIICRKGEEYLLDRASPARPEHIIFPVPAKNSKGVLVIPTAGGTTMIGPTAEITDSKNDTAVTAENMQKILDQTSKMVKNIRRSDIINAFAGIRPALKSGDFYIAASEKVPNLIHAAGIQSPGLTASPAIAEYIAELLRKNGFISEYDPDFQDSLPIKKRLNDVDDEELMRLYQTDPAWTNIICRCEMISEAEIVSAVKAGHITVDAVKFAVRAQMGRCQGGFCSAKIMEIISRTAGISMENLTKRGGNSLMTAGKIGDLEVK